MKKNKIRLLMIVVLCATVMCSACGKNNSLAEKKAPVVCGNSNNMRYGGKVDGNEKETYYVWNNILKKTAEDGTVTVVDENGASNLCLTKDGLFYRSVDKTGKAGIYQWDGTKRSLILETQARFLYAVDEWLYFTEYPTSGSICKVKKDGTEFSRILEGDYDSLNTDGSFLYYRDNAAKEYCRLPIEGEDAVKEVLVQECGREMPILTKGYLYYSLGESYISYRMNLSDMTVETLKISLEQVAADGQTVRNIQEYDSKIMGVAGDRLLYRQKEFTEETRLQYYAAADKENLKVVSGTDGEAIVLESLENETKKGEETAAYERFLAGDVTLLQNGGTEYFPKEAEASYQADADGDGISECFVKEKNRVSVFHYENGSIYWWGSDSEEQGIAYEPLSDGTMLITARYDEPPLHNESYEIVTFERGGGQTRQKAYQHIVLDTKDMEIDSETDTLVPKEQYFAGDEEVDGEAWRKELEEEVNEKRLPEFTED